MSSTFTALDRVVMVRDVAVDSSSIDGGDSANTFPAAVNGDNGIGHENNGDSVKSEEDLFDENGGAEMSSIKLTEIRGDMRSMLFNRRKWSVRIKDGK